MTWATIITNTLTTGLKASVVAPDDISPPF
jgi:hypothetical protein